MVVCRAVKKVTSPASGVEKAVDEDEMNSMIGTAEFIAVPSHGQGQEEGDSAQESGSGASGHETALIFP